MNDRSVLSFDFGASSGRAIVYTYKDDKIIGKEINRFSNTPVVKNGILYWDTDYLFGKIDESIVLALNYDIESIGIDTWGVDFAIVDGDEIILNAINYRDEHIENLTEKTDKRISRERVYELTGIQTMDINTVNRFVFLDEYIPQWRKRKGTMLLMSDLFAWHLTGSERTELTNASTTSMLNAKTRKFDSEIAAKLGIEENMFAPIIYPGEVYGYLKEKYTARKIPVLAVCTHDTASAVAAVPAKEKQFAYLSCGTWSLLGTEADMAVTNEFARKFNFTNEIGYGGTVRLLKNIVGLWIIQEIRRNYVENGKDVSFADIADMAKFAEIDSYIDPDADLFMPRGDMLQRVSRFVAMTGQAELKSDAEKIKSVYESLALKYRYVLEKLSCVTGQKFDVLHVIGGGIQDKYLMQIAANATGLPVCAGPIEATAMGNAAVQFIASGVIENLWAAREIISHSCEQKTYIPQKTDLWNDKYEKFKKIMEAGNAKR